MKIVKKEHVAEDIYRVVWEHDGVTQSGVFSASGVERWLKSAKGRSKTVVALHKAVLEALTSKTSKKEKDDGNSSNRRKGKKDSGNRGKQVPLSENSGGGEAENNSPEHDEENLPG